MLSQLHRRPQQPVVVDEHPAPALPQPRTREHPAPAPLQPVVVDEHPAPLGLGRRQVTWGDNLSRDHLALQPHTRGESAPRSAFLLDNSERNRFFFSRHVGKMRLVLSQISGLTTQVSQTPIDPSRRQFFRNLCRRVPHSYVMESKAQRALEELTRLWNQLRQQHPHRLSEYQQVFDECVLFEQGMDIVFLEMRLRAEFAAPPALESPVAPPQAVANPPAPEEEDYGVRDMEVEPIEDTPTVDLVVAEEVGVVDMEVEPIEDTRDDCKESDDLRAWWCFFNSIPTVSTPPAPAPVEKVEEVVEVKDPIIGMWICFQTTATEVAAVVAVSRKSLSLFVLFLFTFNSHLTLVYMFILITILQHYSQAPLVEEVAAKVAVEEEVDAKHTRKRSAEMNNGGQRPNKRARVHNDASSQVAVEEEVDAKHTRKRSAEMNNGGQRPNKRARVHNDASSQVAVEEEEDVAVVAVSHVVILLFTLLFAFSLNHLTPHSNSPTTHRLPLLRKSLLIPSMKSCQSLLVRGVLMK